MPMKDSSFIGTGAPVGSALPAISGPKRCPQYCKDKCVIPKADNMGNVQYTVNSSHKAKKYS